MAKASRDTPFGITTEQATQLARLDMHKALAECVVNGKLVKPLPPSLRRIVHSVANNGVATNFARNKSELAQALGISRMTLYSLLKRDDCPREGQGTAKYDIAEWKVWAAPLVRVPIKDMPLAPKDAAVIDRNQAQTRKTLFELSVAMRDYLPTREVDEAIDSANAVVERELRKRFETELPPQLEGMKASEIKKTLRAALDEILSGLPKAFKTIEA